MKLVKPTTKYYLGPTGMVGSRDDEKSDARELFLKTIERHAPQVLEDLRKKVYDRWTARTQRQGAPNPKYPRRSIRDWANDWNLTWEGQPADWIVNQLKCTLSDWVNIPKLVGRCWGTFPGSHEHRPVVELFPIPEALMVCPATPDRGSPWDRIEQLGWSLLGRVRMPEGFTFPMAIADVLKTHPELYDEYLKAPSPYSQAITCMPTAYRRTQIRDALRQLQKNVQKALRHTETDRKFRQYLSQKCALEKARSIDAERFVWAVRFQCLGHTSARIAASRDIGWIERDRQLDDAKLAAAARALPAIAIGVREILRLIELTPRSSNKTGLPNT